MKRILFVDDEPKILEGLQRMLRSRRKEWEMLFAQSGAEALELLAARPFEVVVTDVCMPEMDGIELLEQVQKRYPAMIRIVLSGYFEREAALRAAGVAHQYLAKPCDPEKLREAIDSLCRSTALLTNEEARGVVSAIGSLPSPPQTYDFLKQALRKPDVCLEEVGQIIEQDVGMTAKVLQLVNSPLFGLVFEIASVQRALGYIGLATLRQLVLSVEIFQAFEPERTVPGFSLEAFQVHSRLAARIAARLPAPVEVASASVTAALLHDAGKLVLAARLPQPFELALRTALEQARPAYAVEEEVIGTSHAEVGAYLLSLWGLPRPVVDAVWNHHRPSAADPPSEGLDVLAITHFASALADETAAGVAADEPPAAGRWDLGYVDRLGVSAQLPGWRAMAAEVAASAGAGSVQP